MSVGTVLSANFPPLPPPHFLLLPVKGLCRVSHQNGVREEGSEGGGGREGWWDCTSFPSCSATPSSLWKELCLCIIIHFVKFKWKFAVQLIHRIACLRALGTYFRGKSRCLWTPHIHNTYIVYSVDSHAIILYYRRGHMGHGM